MKYFLGLLLSGFLVFSGCGEQGGETEQKKVQQPEPPAVEKAVLVAPTVVLIPGGDFQATYNVKVFGQDVGVFKINRTADRFESFSEGLGEHHNLPFFSNHKQGEVKQGLGLTKVAFDQREYTVISDINDLPDGIRIQKLPWKKVIYGDDNKVTMYLFDSDPVVAMENLLIGYLDNEIADGQVFFYYDSSEVSRFKIRMVATQDGLDVERLNIEGEPAIKLFSMGPPQSGLPQRVVSSSGRWQLELTTYRSL